MKYLIKNCKVIHRNSTYDGKTVDVLVDKGVISSIAKNISDSKATTITGKNLHISIGWMDIGTHLGEPGFEHRETFESLTAAAKAGGFTDLATMPLAQPMVQTKAQIKSLISTGNALGVDIHPFAVLSQDGKGETISEFIDLHQAGAVGFTDGLHPIDKSGVLLRALQYVKQHNGIVLHHPNDSSLGNDNLIHEGNVSTSLGMKGSPSLAESLMAYRDLMLQEYAESRLCLHLISTRESLDLVKNAKRKDSNISLGVSYLNLVKSDEDLYDFDTNLKVQPLLRSEKDMKALRKGVVNDTIDYIASNHVPLEIEQKHLEYPYAAHGAIGLETCFAALQTHASKDLSLEQIIHKLTIGPRETLGLKIPNIEKGAEAKITVFDPLAEWVYDEPTIKSISRNSPFLNTSFTGKVVATINRTETTIIH